MMRVCMIAYTHYDMDGRVRRYAETLAKRGDEVDVIVLRPKGENRYKNVKGVNVFRIQRRIANETKRLEHILKMGVFVLVSGVFVAIKSLHKRYDLVHVHSPPDIEVFAALILRLSGSKIILDIHDIMPEFYLSKFNKNNKSFIYRLLLMLEKMSTNFADHVIVANDIWRGTLISRSIDASRCSVILNYPDKTIFNKVNFKKKDHRMIIIYPGSLNYHQGLDLAIRAFGKIKDKINEAEFHIYGNGSEKDNLVNLTKILNLEDKVLFKNPLPLEEIAEVISNASLGIIPKRARGFGNEAFSTKILEFMAVGIPVIVSDTKVDKLYFDDSLVTFFKSEDENDLADKMLFLMNNEKERLRKAKKSLEFIRINNWETKKQRYLGLIDSLTVKHD